MSNPDDVKTSGISKLGLVIGSAAMAAASFGATPAATADASRPAGEYVVATYDSYDLLEDIQYGEAVNASGEIEELYLDLYRPTVEASLAPDRPVLVFAHGGSFKNGSRKGAEIAGYLQKMTQYGYATATISYRLRPTGTPGSKPNQELIVEAAAGDSDTLADAQHDMQAAVRYLRANAEALGLDGDRIAVGGSSAGAITAMQAAINEEDPGVSGTPAVSSAVAGVVAVSGAADPDHIEPGDPSFLMFHGGADATVPAALGLQACAIAAGLANGCDMVFFPDGGHTPWSRWEDLVVHHSVPYLCRVMMSDVAVCGDADLPLVIYGPGEY